ncbi:MAG: DUF6516 family protein [Acidobacteriota bacterium]
MHLRHSGGTQLGWALSLAGPAPSLGWSASSTFGWHSAWLECIFDIRVALSLAGYDSQPHPNDESLQVTHPHHKHVPPNIKHNRVPAPNMGFGRPNLPALVEEALALIQEARNV